ncbi:MAG: phosphoglucosamine mutase [Phycisphaerales bacterium]
MMMADSPLILGVSGLRGIVGESLTPQLAVRYAWAFGEWLWADRAEGDAVVVSVGRDGRRGGEAVEEAAIEGLLRSGCDVIRMGVASTPTVGVAASGPCCEGGMVITASHNPAQWNGLKCIVNDRAASGSGSRAPLASEAEEIIARFQASDADPKQTRERGIVVAHSSEIGVHVSWAVDSFFRIAGDKPEKKVGKIPVVLDSVNSSGSMMAVPFFERLGNRLYPIACDGSGDFPHTPEPTKENLSGKGGLCDVVPAVNAWVGFAQDPDADRLAIVDEHGVYIGEEYTLVLCAMALMEARASSASTGTKKPVFVVNLSTSRMIDDVAAHYGAQVVRSAVGEANVVEVMKSLKADGRDVVMGGEGNGGVIWAEVTSVRDSLSGMALVMALMARTGKTVSQLVGMINAMGPTAQVREQGYTILKAKSDLASKSDAEPVVRHLHGVYGDRDDCRVDLQDGIRIDWDERGVWAHVRASNTEPIMRVIVEAPSEAEAKKVASEIDAQITQAGA